jgi:acyl-CoA reductase-like NAD-dependent aldehyde dehydrogenase
MSVIRNLREFTSYPVHTSVPTPPASSQTHMDTAITRLRDGAKVFASLSIPDRMALAESMQKGFLRVAARMVEAGCRAKGLTMGTPAEAEEWATGPWGVVRQLRLIRDSLAALKSRGTTSIGPIRHMADNRLAVGLFPGNAIDGMLFKNVSIEAHMQPGVTEEVLDVDRARFYKQPQHDGRVVLVLGAGNIAAIAPMDVVTKMFNEGMVCLLKMNPVNAYLGPFIEEAFGEAIKRGFLAVAYGGAEEGRYLVYHRDIDEVHITGSDKTHDNIVWGPVGPERDARMQRREPLLNKPITSELGNISPVIVVPGPYSDKDLRFQAEDVAANVVMNASFLCCSAKMLVMPSGWSGSDAFTKAVQGVCATVPPRQAYYPGAEERWQTLTADRRNVTQIGRVLAGTLPWAFVSGLDPDAPDEPLFSNEPFCSVLSEVRLGSADPVEFLHAAVEFVNNRLWGTLNANLVVHPKSLKDPRINQAFEYAISKLRYGVVAINGFIGMPFVFAAPPWGAYPGSALEDVQSGRGFVHNTSMLEGIEKTVLRGPVTTFPKPGWFPSHRTAHKVTPSIVAMEENATWSGVPGIVINAMRG